MFHFRRKPFKANHSDAQIRPPERPHLSPPLTLKPAKNPTSFFCHWLLNNTLFKAVKTLVLSAFALNFSRKKKENLSPQSQDIAETSRRPKGGRR